MTGSLFPEWLEQHRDTAPKLPERIQQMLNAHGRTPGQTCKTCAHLMRCGSNKKRWLKCELTKITHGTATDWKAGWPACGKHEEEK